MEIPRHWRLKQQRYGLMGQTCKTCDSKIFPPRDVCPYCGGMIKSENGRFSVDDEAYRFTTTQTANVPEKRQQ